jgi:hypothetical protein
MRAEIRGLYGDWGQKADDWRRIMRAEEESWRENEDSKKRLGYRMRAVRKGKDREWGKKEEGGMENERSMKRVE